MKKLILLLAIIGITNVYAQQDPLFSQYMFNKLAINPGYAGSRESLSADILYRYQWVNIDGAPKTLSASLHSPLRNQHIGLGFTAYNDRIGPTNMTGAFGTFAYRIFFPKSTLSFGLQLGARYSNLDKSRLHAHNPNDPFLLYDQARKFAPDANFGVYYYSDRYYLGISSKQLFGNTIITVNTGQEGQDKQFYRLAQHFYGMAGLAIPMSREVTFRPSLLAKFTPNAPAQLDFNASFLFSDLLWLGVSYRTEKALSAIAELYVTNNLKVGYSYDIWLNELKVLNKGSHEIRLSVDLNVVNSRMRTPRYF
ncbi:MAG: type IX secretion system membrane protein PorP/SprF [Bacteroidales bacterium]|jgi:type IX secretion system PorP/SprF family membrane protein